MEEERLNENKLTVLIVSSNVRVLHALAMLVQRSEELDYAGCARSVEEALPLVRLHPPELVISNIPPANVEQALLWRRLREMKPRTLMFSTYLREDEMILSAISRACGHVLTWGGPRWLESEIIRAATGECLMPRGILDRLSAIAAGKARSPLDNDQRYILGLVIEGADDDVIGRELGVAPGEVGDRLRVIATTLLSGR